jgi:hypothetical protein
MDLITLQNGKIGGDIAVETMKIAICESVSRNYPNKSQHFAQTQHTQAKPKL